ncbi:DcaP family trimeric outer membrane transporter [Mangrovivirga sp. M17]|uniref:DcaP family trimeric outer membrane transporter n=1 Tax=Mangrovivirga halotolerans TaxID=2993936 RepID=A0ABT3RQQ3_9BACT|nr:DcaP family trimeric outer membrane transporter [Mangrovivirga halotolerans]MCX2743883.1 DcaP family trimeric outer membrane transporter [Mangrovivirga halotolerans]
MSGKAYRLPGFLLLLLFTFHLSFSQDVPDSLNRNISGRVISSSDSIIVDTTRIIEDAPLDIGQDRGLFIISADKKLQLRILGSVRYHVVMDQNNLESENSFNTHEIPTGDDNNPIFNYSNQISQTRLGFEVTHSTSSGNVFIRLETDFAGADGFRIRHAYGQFKNVLFGQTWSLFSHVTAVPATVDFAGPTSSINIRTPQMRYTLPNIWNNYTLDLGLEYLVPNINLPDSIEAEIFQLTPDFTARIRKNYNWGQFQISGILPVLSGRNIFDEVIVKFGYGLSASVVINSWKQGKWYFQSVVGRGISRYFNDLDNNVLDVIIDKNNKLKLPLNYGFNATYEHSWNEKWLTSFTYGILQLERFAINPDEWYFRGQTIRSNTFWDVSDGAKIGGEIIWGQRTNKNFVKGDAIRVNVLVYYDF